MFRSVGFVALVLAFSLTLDVSAPVGIAAHTETSIATESSVASLPVLEGRTISESSLLMLVGFALISASRAARR
jgi:hypothetical protein